MSKWINRNPGLRRLMCALLALIMVLGIAPAYSGTARANAAATDTTVYLVPNSNWLVDNARFAVYYWDGSGSYWTDMTDADGDGYYEAVIPAGYSNIIFCRMNPGTTENNWNNKWNQTSDLTVPTDGTNCYTVADGTWDSGGGTWSTYTPDVVLYLKPNSNWLMDNARFAVYYWDNNSSYWADMTDTDGDGYYGVSIPDGYSNIIFCRMNPGTTANDWANKWNQTSDLTVPTDGTNCYTVADGTWDSGGGTWSVYPPEEEGGETEALYIVAGSAGLCGTAWDTSNTANRMTLNGDGLYEITYENVPAGSYEFKVTDGSWDNCWGDNGNNYTFTLTETSTVTITFDADTKAITVTTGALTTDPAGDYYLVGYINGADYGFNDDWQNLGVYKFVDGKLTATFTQDSYVFVKTGDNANWYMAESYCTDASVTLKNTSTGTSEKLFVPGNTELTFTLVENADGSLTLSYAVAGTEVEIPEGYTAVTIHFYRPEGWGSTINAYTWNGHDNGAWPGSAIGANAAHSGWYDLVVPQESPSAFNFIFNDGGNQTADLYTGEVTGDTELWVIGNTVYTTAPGEWSGDYDYTANIHFQKPEGWGETINAWIWDANGAIEGYEQYQTTWPGSPIEADAINAGWYNISVTVDENTGFSFILNDSSNQTANLSTGTLDVTTDIWVVNGEVLTSAPDGWVDPNREIYVPGTFPGPSWDAASNRMTYDPELGLYVYTFENVPAGNYEFKIAVGGSWTENYGVGGYQDGANIAVTVPEAMDVIVYYNDNTHYAVTNVTYVFADITLVVNGEEVAQLTDQGLTGVYSATVSMEAGTYTDVKLTCNGKDYLFHEIELAEGKDVTFYMDPITEIYYCDASNIPVDSSSIYFNSQDSAYKSIFGALEQNEECTFSIKTGEDVTSAVLVVTGVGSYPMTKNGNKWSVTVSFANMGEYDYYFALSNGYTMAIYSDDDGYYGAGKVCSLSDKVPYDLVVYKEGYETPDWMKNAIIYQIFPDRFCNGDPTNDQAQTWARGEVDYEFVEWGKLPENPEQEAMNPDTYPENAYQGDGEWSNEIYGGDLQGIIDNIDYLKELGVNVIYLNPVFWSISNHRYDAVDYTKIDPILGTLGDFEELVAVAEANDMHIILDGVFNHVSDDSIYFDRYYKFLGTSEKIGAYPYWAYVYDYMADNGVSQGTAEAAAKAYFSANYGITDYSYTEWFAVSSTTMSGTVDNIGLRAGKEVYSYEGWWGYDSMPVIYSTNGSEYQTGNWAEEIIGNEDGTAVSQYWISKGSDGWRLDVANEVSDETWQAFRESVKALDSDAVIIGEIWDDATKYLLGDMYDSVMNYVFRNAVTAYVMGGSSEQAAKELEKLRERYPEEAFYAMMNLVGSHDTSRILSYLDGIGDDRNQKDIESAFPTYENTSDLAKERQYLVAFLQFTYPGAPTIYYGDEIGMVGADDPDDRRTFEWEVLTGTSASDLARQELLAWYSNLAAIRSEYSALSTGSIEMWDLDDSSLLAYVRSDAEGTVLVIANNAQSNKAVVLEDTYVDLLTGETVTGTVTIEALRGVILLAEQEQEEDPGQSGTPGSPEDVPPTGDENPVVWFVVLLVLSLAGVVILTIYLKKKKN